MTTFPLLGKVAGCAGGLVVRAEPADEAALSFRRPLVVEGDEAAEQLLFEHLSFGSATGEEVGGWGAL